MTSLVFLYARRAARNAGDRLHGLEHGLEHCTFVFPVLKTPGGAIVKRLKRNFAAFAILSLGASLLGGLASAHHGTGVAYETDKSVTLKGTVTEFLWASPHSKILFDAKDTKGSVVYWRIETLSPGKLARAGWTKDAVKPGDQITVTFSPAKNGSPTGFLQKVVFLDGKQLGMLEHPQ